MLYSGFNTLPRSVVRRQTGFAARITRTLCRCKQKSVFEEFPQTVKLEVMDNQITISQELRQKIEQLAAARGVAFDDFVRQTLENCVSSSGRKSDPLFGDNAVFRGDAPTDGAANHDDYLYGDAS